MKGLSARAVCSVVIIVSGPACTALKPDDFPNAPSDADGVDANADDSGTLSDDAGRRDASSSDAGATRDGADAGSGPCDLTRPFDPPRQVAGLTSFLGAVGDLRLSPDLLTGYFSAQGGDAGPTYNLYTATRPEAGAPFASITPIVGPGINNGNDVISPTVRGDGEFLIYARTNAPNGAERSLFWATRASAGAPFDDRGALPSFDDAGATAVTTPYLREDGAVLYFASNATPISMLDIYRATWNGSRLDGQSLLANVNSFKNDFGPVITPDELTLFFTSDRNGGLDIWMATRGSTNVPFSAPVSVMELNTQDAEWPTFVTRDGCTLYLSSNRQPYGITQYVASRPAR